jgi:hypothetical protein
METDYGETTVVQKNWDGVSVPDMEHDRDVSVPIRYGKMDYSPLYASLSLLESFDAHSYILL